MIISASDRGGSSLESVTPKAQVKDGYTWLPVKVPDSNPIVVTAVVDGKAKSIGDIVHFFTTVKSNIKGHGIFTMRYMAMGEEADIKDPGYTLGLTLTTFQATDTTLTASPPLQFTTPLRQSEWDY